MKPGYALFRSFGLCALPLVLGACDSGPTVTKEEEPFIVTYDRPFEKTIVSAPIETHLPEEDGVRDLRMGDLVLSAGSEVAVLPIPQGEFGPAYIFSDLRIENRSETPVTIFMPVELSCPFIVDVYAAPERAGKPISTPATKCVPSEGPLGPKSAERSIAPGEAQKLRSEPDVQPLNEDGRYYLLARPIINGDTLAVAAGSVDYYRTPPNLAYHVRMELQDAPVTDSIHTSLEIENVGLDTVFVAWPCYSVNVVGFLDESRTGAPAFDWQSTLSGGCLEGSHNEQPNGWGRIAIRPGERTAPIQLRASFGTNQVMGQADVPGLYHFKMEFEQGVIMTRDFEFVLGGVHIED